MEHERGLLCLVAVASAVCVAACQESRTRHADTVGVSTPCAAVVRALGNRLRLVSLLAPDSAVKRSLRDAFAGFATPELLEQWQATPRQAPGREVSSPWPARITIDSVQAEGKECRVTGAVEYVTSADTMTPVERRPVTIQLVLGDGWRVRTYEAGTGSRNVAGNDSADAANPADVVRDYYAAIAARNYAAAYALWGQNGGASGQTLQEFARGFANTARVRASISDSVSLGAAAGSQYATVPVTVDAQLRSGRAQHFTGTYTIRRAMVDGATPEQRRWHIYKAELRER